MQSGFFMCAKIFHHFYEAQTRKIKIGNRN